MSNQEEAQLAQEVQLDTPARAGEALLDVHSVFMHASINISCRKRGEELKSGHAPICFILSLYEALTNCESPHITSNSFIGIL